MEIGCGAGAITLAAVFEAGVVRGAPPHQVARRIAVSVKNVVMIRISRKGGKRLSPP